MDQSQISQRLERFYDIDSSRYRQAQWFSSLSARSFYDATWRLIFSQAQLQPDNRILEIGCGPGTWTKLLSPIVREMVAIDLSAGMIQQAKDYVNEGRVRFLQGDFLTYDFVGERFDRIISVRVLEYFVDPAAVLAKCFQLLNPGGRAIFITKSPSPIWKYRSNLLHRLRRWGLWIRENIENIPADKGYDRLFWQRLTKPEELISFAKAQGFARCQTMPVLIRLPIVAGGFAELPLLKDRNALRYLLFSERLTEKINAGVTFLRKLSIFMAESYALIVIKPKL